jgi:hypothetical protein
MKEKQNNLKNKKQNKWQIIWCCVLPLSMALVVAGCKQYVKEASGINPAGTYALVTVDGNKVPCTVNHEGHTMTISSGSFIINSNGTCNSKMVLAGRDAPIEVKATYKQEGPTLKMQWQGAGTTTGTVTGDTFTMNNEGMVFAYQK